MDSKEKSGKLRKYNERLFAVFGSLGAILFISLLAMLAYSEVIKPLLRSSYEPIAAMISDEETQDALERGLRLQAASYEMARRLFDNLPYYVIPVGQRTLEEPVKISHVALFSSGSGRSYWQHTNNLIVWNQKTGESRLVLPERLQVSRRVAYLEHGDPYLLVNTQRISEGRKVKGVRIADWALWVYGLEDGSLAKIDLPGKVVVEFGTPDESELAFALVGEDRNGDGVYDRKKEPTLLYQINAKAGTLSPAVPEAIRVRVQDILDGRSQETE